MSDAVQSCGNCLFFYKQDCRASAPRVAVTANMITTTWPYTTPDEWCGSWKDIGGFAACVPPTVPPAQQVTP